MICAHAAPVRSTRSAMGQGNKMIKLGKYKHYKGDTVEVIGEALHSETLEEFVAYKHISGKHARSEELL